MRLLEQIESRDYPRWHRLGHIIAVKFCQKSLSDLTDQKFVCSQGCKFNANWQQGSHQLLRDSG